MSSIRWLLPVTIIALFATAGQGQAVYPNFTVEFHFEGCFRPFPKYGGRLCEAPDETVCDTAVCTSVTQTEQLTYEDALFIWQLDNSGPEPDPADYPITLSGDRFVCLLPQEPWITGTGILAQSYRFYDQNDQAAGRAGSSGMICGLAYCFVYVHCTGECDFAKDESAAGRIVCTIDPMTPTSRIRPDDPNIYPLVKTCIFLRPTCFAPTPSRRVPIPDRPIS